MTGVGRRRTVFLCGPVFLIVKKKNPHFAEIVFLNVGVLMFSSLRSIKYLVGAWITCWNWRRKKLL